MDSIENLKGKILTNTPKPTEEQQKAIFEEDKEFVLLASPGSGKTLTSSRRFVWRAANRKGQIGGIALLSYTNKAVKEFYDSAKIFERFDLFTKPNFIGTFDSFVDRFIIKKYAYKITKNKRIPELVSDNDPFLPDNNKLCSWLERDNGQKIRYHASKLIPYLAKKDIVYKLDKDGKKLTNYSCDPVKELFKEGFYTHNQRIYFAILLIKAYPKLASLLSKRFPEIIVDEAQDTNFWLLILLNKLHENGTKITVIGDQDQCIYEFNMADPLIFSRFLKKWKLKELNLNQSFRCNNIIAEVACNIRSSESKFIGNGDIGNDLRKAYIIKESTINNENSINQFFELINKANIDWDKCFILGRKNEDINAIYGNSNIKDLQTMAKSLALISYNRFYTFDFYNAYIELLKISLGLIDNYKNDFIDSLDDEDFFLMKLKIWRFLKSDNGIPSVELIASDWFEKMKSNLAILLEDIGVSNVTRLGNKIRNNLSEENKGKPLFELIDQLNHFRIETVHQVKGESLDGVLLLGSTKFFNSVVESVISDNDTENRRIAYVAMTRARHIVLISLPESHYNKYKNKWLEWGFEDLE